MQGQFLRKLVERFKMEHNLNKEDIAEGLGVNKSYLSRLFRKEELPITIIYSACDYFGVEKNKFDYHLPSEKIKREKEQLEKDKAELKATIKEIENRFAKRLERIENKLFGKDPDTELN